MDRFIPANSYKYLVVPKGKKEREREPLCKIKLKDKSLDCGVVGSVYLDVCLSPSLTLSLLSRAVVLQRVEYKVLLGMFKRVH